MAGGGPAAAAGANIAVSAASALVGAAEHARAGRVDWRLVAWMAPPSVAAAFAGGFLAGEVPEDVLLAGVAALVLWNGLQLLAGTATTRSSPHPEAAAVASGAAIGLVGGAVGLILGTLRLPALLGPVGLAAHRAVGTNLAVGFFLGVAGFAGHASRSAIDWPLLLVGLAAALPATVLGARLAGRLSDRALRKAIGVALVAVGIALAVEAAA